MIGLSRKKGARIFILGDDTVWGESYRSGLPNSKSVNSNVCLIQTFVKISATFLSL